MTMHEPTLDIVSATNDARNWLSMTLGLEAPLIPHEVARTGSPILVIQAAHARLAQIRVLAAARARTEKH